MSEVDLRGGTDKHVGWIHSLPQVHACVSGITAASLAHDFSSSTDLIDVDGDIIRPEGMLVTASDGWGHSEDVS